MGKRINTAEIIAAQKDEHKVFDTPEMQILAKPDMWLGSTSSTIHEISVLEQGEFIEKEIEIIPALSKIIEEIINNSADEHIRSKDPKFRGWTLDKIKVRLEKDGTLKVWDNGGIKASKRDDGFYPIEVIFGRLFSSGNYDDTKERKLGGTNGVGSSLTNLFSNRFRVISADNNNSVEVTWTNNKSEQSEPFVKEASDHFTMIDAELDLLRFDVDEIPYGIMKYIERKCIILAASKPGLEVTFNDEVYKFDSFRDYVDMYKLPVIGEKNQCWEIYLAPCVDTMPKRFAIVNGYECNEGTHIKHAEMLINWHIQEALKREKITNISAQQILSSYTVFINIEIDKPKYTSQSKSELASAIFYIDKDGKKKNLYRSDEFKKQIETGDIFKILQEKAREKDFLANSKEFQKKVKELKGKSANSVKKLLDAGETNKSKRKDCELWIFEGESAGSGFRTGRFNPKLQGSYFLKGKCVNSIEMSTMKILNNQEFSDLIIAIGLDPKNPSDMSKLRYGKINVSTDMDYDGYSIFTQVATLFAIHFPEVINRGMLNRVISPLYRATKGKDTHYFYDNESFHEFSKKNKGYTSRYFKGLGSLKKEDYAVMLQDTILEQFSMDDVCLTTLHALVGSDSKPRKRLLEAQV